MRSTGKLLGLALGILALTSCDDGEAAARHAATRATALSGLLKDGVAQLRRGLPEGAKRLGREPAELADDLRALQTAVARARVTNEDLRTSRVTFFALTDASGVVLRSETDPDNLAQHGVFAAFPALRAALEPGKGRVEALGQMPELSGATAGRDRQWIAGEPVLGADGKPRGLLITGFSLRRYAAYLEEVAKHQLSEEAEKKGKTAIPIVYALLVVADTAYGSPLLPDVTTEAVDHLALTQKTASGPYQTTTDVSGTVYGVGAERAPDLGPDVAIAVLLSGS